MPELPEVETIVRALREDGRGGDPIINRVITSVHLLWDRTLAEPDPGSFIDRITGQPILDVHRRGKFLVFTLQPDYLIIHLRMSGDLRVEPANDETGEPRMILPHDRLVMNLTGGIRISFNDTRKFGRVWLVPDLQTVLSALGPEPLDDRTSAEEFFRYLSRFDRQIKPLLLDQSFIAGLGNIYTDEALHMAKIHPLRRSSSLTPEEAALLWSAIRMVLEEGILRNGASFDWVYRGGDFQNTFQVYQQTGKPCPQCGTPIVKIAVGQRGTHFCPICQKAEK